MSKVLKPGDANLNEFCCFSNFPDLVQIGGVWRSVIVCVCGGGGGVLFIYSFAQIMNTNIWIWVPKLLNVIYHWFKLILIQSIQFIIECDRIVSKVPRYYLLIMLPCIIFHLALSAYQKFFSIQGDYWKVRDS